MTVQSVARRFLYIADATVAANLVAAVSGEGEEVFNCAARSAQDVRCSSDTKGVLVAEESNGGGDP